MCGSFCIKCDLCGISSAPKLTFCVAGLVCTCFGSPGLTFAFVGLVCTCLGFPCAHSASGTLCALVCAALPALLCHRAVCTCFVSLPPLFIAGVICSFCREGCVNCPSLYTSPLLAPQSLLHQLCLLHHVITWSCHLCCKGCAHWLDLSAPSHLATWAHPLCCKAECAGWVCMPPLSVPQARCLGPVHELLMG